MAHPTRRSSNQTTTRRDRSARCFQAAVEGLERRELKAADIQLINHQLYITGTAASDTAEVYYDPGSPGSILDDAVVATITPLGGPALTRAFPRNTQMGVNVTMVRFGGLEGDDRFTNRTTIRTDATGNSGNDTLVGGAGADYLNGGDGNDTFTGGDGNDLIDAGAGNDSLTGGAGNDTLNGHSGNDTIWGGAGNDVLNGGVDHDYLFGEADHDSLVGDAGVDWLDGGYGNDTISGGNDGDSIFGGLGLDVLQGGAGSDLINGGPDNDTLTGGEGNDTLEGGTGNDSLQGEGGKDVLRGEDGNDTLNGGSDGQADEIAGGTLGDVFTPEWFKDGNVWKNRELNLDFNAAQGDRLAAAPNTPLQLVCTQLKCLEETDEVGADEPYVVFWVGNLNAPQASYATRTTVLGDVDAGETRTPTTAVWGSNPAPIASPADLVILSVVVENDSSDPNAVVSSAQAMMLPSLLAALSTTANRAELVAKLRTDMQGAVGLGVATGAINQDEFSEAHELVLTQAHLDGAREGIVQNFVDDFWFDGGHYRVSFSLNRTA